MTNFMLKLPCEKAWPDLNSNKLAFLSTVAPLFSTTAAFQMLHETHHIGVNFITFSLCVPGSTPVGQI